MGEGLEIEMGFMNVDGYFGLRLGIGEKEGEFIGIGADVSNPFLGLSWQRF